MKLIKDQDKLVEQIKGMKVEKHKEGDCEDHDICNRHTMYEDTRNHTIDSIINLITNTKD